MISIIAMKLLGRRDVNLLLSIRTTLALHRHSVVSTG